MDSVYIKKNFGSALADAMTAMNANDPTDKVEFMGKYLLEYAKRRKLQALNDKALQAAEERARLEREKEVAEETRQAERRALEAKYTAKVVDFLESLEKGNFKDKQAVFNTVVNFIKDHLKIPASYIAVKKIINDKETLCYVAASKGQEFVVGKKLVKASAEGEDLPPRQGFTFDAFNIPEAVDDASGGDDQDENAPPKSVPVPLPLIIDNVMRDRRCQFFKAPKLGAFVAVPLSYQTTEHDVAIVAGSGEDGSPPYTVSKVPQELIIACDTIADYRSFKSSEVAMIQEIGKSMICAFEEIDAANVETQLNFLETMKKFSDPLAEELAKIVESEASAISNVSQELSADPSLDPPPEPTSETLKPFREAEEIMKLWRSLMSAAPVNSPLVALKDHVLPTSTAIANLFYAIGCLLNMNPSKFKDVFGDISWEPVRDNLRTVIAGVSKYNPTAALKTSDETSISAIKAFCASANVFDMSQYPSSIPVLGAMATWLQKAVGAREAAVVHLLETKKIDLEKHVSAAHSHPMYPHKSPSTASLNSSPSSSSMHRMPSSLGTLQSSYSFSSLHFSHISKAHQVLYRELREKLPYHKNDDEIVKRKQLWKAFGHANGHGDLTLIQVERGLREVVKLPDLFLIKPVIIRSYAAARAKCLTTKHRKKDHHSHYNDDDTVHWHEFRWLLKSLLLYYEMWMAFDTLDASHSHQIGHEEFVAAKPLLEGWGIDMSEPEKEWKELDANSDGKIHFEEFSQWAIVKHLEFDPDEENDPDHFDV